MRDAADSAAAPATRRKKLLRWGSFIAPSLHFGRRSLSASLRLDVRGPDHLAPLLDLFGDELGEVGGRARKHSATKIGKPRLHFGVGEGRIDLLIELLDDLSRRILGRTKARPRASFVAWYKIVYGGDIGELLAARRCRHRQWT